ncbi:MAG: hypothetical protein A3G36_00490 [Omnitrophica bacterium RIFCSPLOWO2_12_FULL_45_13]|nr:MAG: hypothetical protein A3G36_00490 [Omnitrophica bacterium RIFCSPLOWO2_12_FULL_45_13]
MIKLIIKFIIGVVALPLAYGVTLAFYKNAILISELAKKLDYFIWGIVIYVILHLLFYKPTYFYVLGHEAVHAGMAWIFGGKIKSFKVSEDGGAVKTDKSNFVIELAPYFIPIYAIIITAVYFVIASSYAINSTLFIFLIGFALAFHIISTIEIMKIKQPDIVKSGYFFSIIMVYVINIIVIALIFSLVFPGFSIKKFFIDVWSSSRYIYTAAIRQLFF